MKTIRLLFVSFGLLLFVSACNNDTKTDTWSSEQKATWTKNCKEFMKTNGVEEMNAVDFCDCMLKKTSEKYTAEEAANITEVEERKLWESCDYTW
ncbi:MAG: hypothetical protein H8E34_13760 [Bacteroidetes bacterium]|nr:hypothetical protein [Bacteroidota bacterium]MBL6944232.1 hypothetical protein [Bacteroidales bacterium]